MNLFIFVIQDPHLASVPADIALMEMIVGHLSYLEYETGNELRFPFAREIVRLSYSLAETAQKRDIEQAKLNQESSASELRAFDDHLFPFAEVGRGHCLVASARLFANQSCVQSNNINIDDFDIDGGPSRAQPW